MSEKVVYTERVGNDHDPNCHACKGLIAHTRHVMIPANYHSEIANLEWAVITNAITWRRAVLKKITASPTYRLEMLVDAIDALIAAREAELKEE